jgi:hypothetical protein
MCQTSVSGRAVADGLKDIVAVTYMTTANDFLLRFTPFLKNIFSKVDTERVSHVIELY